eukprot:3978350-Pyramimonas_sp.AAC.1
MKGMILNDEDLDEDSEDDEDEEDKEDGMLGDEFSDFDSNKITMSDMAAIDIGGDMDERDEE